MPKVVTAKKTGLASKVSYKTPPKRGPLWLGPEDGSSLGGITQSMINNFLSCRSRMYIKYIEGLQPVRGFDKHQEFGNLWHFGEENYSKTAKLEVALEGIKSYAKDLCKRFPLQQEEIEKWFSVCRLQYPLYVEHWKKHPDNLQRTPLMQEQVFHVPYKLPSGRTVYLRGKFDAVDLIKEKSVSKIFIQENKSKGDINVERLQRQLTFDLQSLTYTVALNEWIKQNPKQALPNLIGKIPQFGGVRYNVIRRPLSGGRGSIVRHKATANKAEETYESYYARLSAIIKEDCESPDPEKNQYWFSRWKVEVTQSDIETFKIQFLNPFLEELCLWYDWVSVGDPWRAGNEVHYRHPFGVFNPLTDGSGESDVDNYIQTGSTSGLTKVDTLFGELQ